MCSNRETLLLGDVLDQVIDHRGKTPKKLGGDFVDHGIRVLSAKNVVGGSLDVGDVRHVTPEMYDRWMPSKLQIGDVLLTSEAPLGEVAYLRSDAEFCLGQRLFALRADPNRLYPRYLYYALRSKSLQDRLQARATGTTAQGIRQSELVKVPIELPPLPEQRAIAHILGTLDEKIELNRQMNATLEEMARALFKSWFVDFDPVRAKAAGRQPFGMDAETAALFPDSFEQSELGEIPRGWKTSTLADEFAITMGQSPPGSTYNQDGEGLPFFQGRADFRSRFPRRRVFCSVPRRLAQLGDTLLSVRAPVGDINMAIEDCAIGRGVAAIRHRSGSRSYTYEVMRNLQRSLQQFDTEGTVFGAINKQALQWLTITVPTEDAVRLFDSVADPISAMIEQNELQMQVLNQLRNSLLPQLLSRSVKIICERSH